MSTSSGNSAVVYLFRGEPRQAASPQFNSWLTWLGPLVSFVDRTRQREALRALADNKHLLADIGMSRREALDEADRPFWQ
jgi:uncharacterized protein YjiS (DUF1127 family)